MIVPAFDEAEHIGLVLRSMPAFVDRILVIDDASRDATAERAGQVADARVRVIRHARNAGVGMALCTGYRAALAEDTDIFAVMAGDGQMHPDDLEALLAPVVAGTADYAKGDRLSHPEVVRRMPLTRLIGNHVLSFCTRIAIGLSVRDSQCGYTVLHRRAAERLTWRELWPGYGYPNDLLGQLAKVGARVCDVTVRPVYADEKSGIRLRHALFVIPYVLARVFLRRASLLLPRRASGAALQRSAAEGSIANDDSFLAEPLP